MQPSLQFCPHRAVASQELSALLDLCFGPDRHLKTASRIRDHASRIDSASFMAVAATDGRLLGSVECWNICWQSALLSQPMALLGPLAAHPDMRRLRIGMQLMDRALAELDRLQLPVMLIGDEPYYGRWGFSAEHTSQWQLPGPVERHRLLFRCAEGSRFDSAANIAGDRSAITAATGCNPKPDGTALSA